MKILHRVLFGASFGLFFGCAGRFKPDEPIDVTGQACCSEGDKELQHFKGCRPTGRCRQSEPYWLRGAVTCGPVDEANCDGGRCCEYRPRYGPSAGEEGEGEAVAGEAEAEAAETEAEAEDAEAEAEADEAEAEAEDAEAEAEGAEAEAEDAEAEAEDAEAEAAEAEETEAQEAGA